MREDFDAAYEFDAPSHYDFRRTSIGTSQASHWFDTHEGTPNKAALADVTNTEATAVASLPTGKTPGKGPVAASPTPAPKSTRKKNIVTGWGGSQQAPAPAPAANAGPAVSKATPAPGRSAPAAAAAGRLKAASTSHQAPGKRLHTSTQLAQPKPNKRVRMTPQEPESPAAAAAASAADAQAPPLRMITRSITKKRLEEAALESASARARKTRLLKSVKTALHTLRTSTSRLASTDVKPRAVASSTTRARGTAPARPALAGGVKKPARRTQPAAHMSKVPVPGANTSRRPAGQAAATGLQSTAPSRAAGRRGKVSAPLAAAVKQVRVRKAPNSASQSTRPAPATGPSSKARMQTALRPRQVGPQRSTKRLTIPDEPHLTTHDRARRGAKPADVSDAEEAGAKTPFKPLALKVKEFHSKTPGRFKTRPAPREPARPLAITQPKEPHLQTSSRARPSTLKPTHVLEEEELAALPAFHARPFNADLLKPGPQLLTRPEPRPLTEPQPFHFVSDDRAGFRGHRAPPAIPEDQVAAQQFKARPLNPHILEAPTHLPKKPRMSLTVPVSPQLLTKTRASEVLPQWNEVEAAKQQFKSRPVPSFLRVPIEFHDEPAEPLHVTEPQPFALRTEQRGASHQQKLQAKVSEERAAAAAARRRRASQMPPSLHTAVVPAKPDPKPLTVPEPFALQSEVLHEEFVGKFNQQTAQEQAQAKADAEFKARPMWDGIPYQLHPSDLPLTVPQDLVLATQERAVERQEFDAAVQDKMRAQEAEKAAAALEAARQEEEAVKQYRRSLRFKAQPVPDFSKPFAPAPSHRPLTQPKTPQFGRKRQATDQPGQ